MTAVGVSRAPITSSAQVDFGPRYRVEKLLGQGGMGAVYKAYDVDLNRTVALKLVRPELMVHPEAMQRFKQELLLASKISHRNILRIHDLGEVAGTKFISMAFIDGSDLHRILQTEGKLSIERTLSITKQLCAALEAAHREDVVHRDMKPQNIMLDKDDHVYVSDFGLAKSIESEGGMTMTGELLGTPRYMAPEQIECKPVDGRTDLYALGLIMYEMLTGDVPFQAVSTTTFQLMYKRANEAPPPPKVITPDIPDWLNQVVMKCLERDPAQRYQNAAELLADIEAEKSPKLIASIAGRRRKLKKALLGIAVAVVVLAAVLSGMFLRGRMAARHAAGEPKPATVLVADFTNLTGDPVLNGTLEPMFNIALEGANFINAYNRGTARKLAQKLPNPTNKLDEQSARLVALSQGIDSVITGEISLRGNAYTVSAVALDAATGNVLAKSEATAPNKDAVVDAIPKAVAPIRKALGDNTPESAQLDSERGAFTASSVEVVHQYALATERQLAGDWEGAMSYYAKAAQLDPDFARAYSGMAAQAYNLGQRQLAEKNIKLAMEHVDRMTERERYRIRGQYYQYTGDTKKAVEDYKELLAHFPVDFTGIFNLASSDIDLRNFSSAVEEARRAVEIYPKRSMTRQALSFYSSYVGDFQTAEKEARAALDLSPSSETSYLALAEAQLGQGQLLQAAETYNKLQKLSAVGASMAASGLADLAVYEGRYSDAVRILGQAADADLAAKNTENAADKFAALGHAQVLRGQNRAAVEATEKLLASSKSTKAEFLAARNFVDAGELGQAKKLATALGSEMTEEPQAYAKIIEGTVALKSGDARKAIEVLTDANKVLDTWIGHYDLARAYLEAGAFVDADAELDRCITRRGESLELWLNNVPTSGYFPTIYYLQGRVREGLKSPGYAESYRTYVSIRGNAAEDPLIPETRRRLGQ